MNCKAKAIRILIVVYPFLSSTLLACPQCRAAVQHNIYNQNFSSNLFVMLLPLLILGSIGIATFYADNLKKKVQRNALNGKK